MGYGGLGECKRVYYQLRKVLLSLYFRWRLPRDLLRGFPQSLTFPITILLAMFTEYFSLESSSLANLLMSSRPPYHANLFSLAQFPIFSRSEGTPK